ncbi:hypothetical protein NFI96_022994 [Prochilodus magdalenae]|nr:hypothetical protein NFI96_022994 [Prochilodus magdalenae]
MAFRRLQHTLMLFLFLNIIKENVSGASSVREKCVCPQETGFVKWRRISDFQIKVAEPLCNKVQIMIKNDERKKQACILRETKKKTR